MRIILLLAGCLALVLLASCKTSKPGAVAGGKVGTMTITSTAFTEGAMIPRKYSCDGDSVSPPLAWSGAPGNTQSLALTVIDPDAPGGTFIHWVLFNLPPNAKGLPENVPKERTLANGAVQGMNSAHTVGYTPPCPPKGNSAHRYYFTVYALDARLNATSDIGYQQLLDLANGHILAQGQVMGRYQR